MSKRITPGNRVKVILHKHYEFDFSQIQEKLKLDDYKDVEMTEEVIKEKAEEMAKYYLSEEMKLFDGNAEITNDFVSVTVEIEDKLIVKNLGETPTYDSEDCETCVEECEENGIEYTHDFTWNDGIWVCDHCGLSN